MVSFLLFGGSFILCTLYFIYWYKVIHHFNTELIEIQPIPTKTVTVLIPFRNEELHLPKLIQALPNCNSFNQLEFYFVNDHSSDSSMDVLKNHLSDQIWKNRFKIIDLPENLSGKKDAIRFAVKHINTNWIHLLDADCIPNPETFECLFTKTATLDCKIVLGPVAFEKSSDSNNIHELTPTYLESYQILENTALIALGFYHLKNHSPSMGNAANMLFNVEFFKKNNPYKNNIHIVGGDDIFLIETAYKSNPNSIKYANSNLATVKTNVLPDFYSLWNQRIRWAKKTSAQSLLFTRNSQIILLLFFLIQWVSLVYWGLYSHDYLFIALFGGFKSFADLFILQKLLQTNEQKISILKIIFSSIFQSIFIPIIAIAQFFVAVEWKNRKF